MKTKKQNGLYMSLKRIMIFALIIFILANYSKAQTKDDLKRSGIPIEILFPQGKKKALILSYDDGKKYDRELVKLMNKYKLVGTFHLNSNKFDTKDYLKKNEIKELFSGHEVSVHSFNHPSLTSLSKIDIFYEIVEDRKELELIVSYPIRGMAYPFGSYNEKVIETIKDLGIEYARTVNDTYNFKIPENFLKWDPTIHQFAKAFWIPDDTENDQKELAIFYKTINEFIQTKEVGLLDVWGHSWEMGDDKNKWDELEKFFKMIANNDAIYYTTQIAFTDYILAFKNLKYSVDKTIFYNPSAITLFFKLGDKNYIIKSNETLTLIKE